MKKIYIQKNDSAATVVNKLLTSHEREVTIYIPKETALMADPKSFRLIKREAGALKKKITVESVSTEVLDAASSAGMAVSDAIFGRRKNRFVDIVPSGKKGNVELHIMSGNELCDGTEAGKENVFDARNILSERSSVGRDEEEYVSEKGEVISGGGKPALIHFLRLAFSFIILSGVLYLGFFILPRATVELKLKEVSWDWKSNVSGSASVSSASSTPPSIPVQIFKLSKSGVFYYPAGGSKMVEKKSSGKITVYNAYSSESQPLVKNTRFVTPEGKIFRLTASIVVPGAKISEGKIQPSSIEVAVEADAAGDAYNTGPVAKLRIPGFQGGPKYDGFYGEFKNGAEGGFVGVMKVATDEDLKKAGEASRKNIENGLLAEVATSIPTGFTTIPGGMTLAVLREGLTAEPDEKGEFGYGISMEAKLIAFREEDVVSIADANFEKDKDGAYDPRHVEISYGTPSVDWGAGKITLPVEVSGIWARAFDPEKFKAEILGKKYADFRAAAISVPGTESVKSALWPFWTRSVPKNTQKVRIIIN